jgi:hypothetical protein
VARGIGDEARRHPDLDDLARLLDRLAAGPD